MLQGREEESKRQARILGQQQKAQHAKHAAGDVVRAVPALAGKTRLQILYELQDVVSKRCRPTALKRLNNTGTLLDLEGYVTFPCASWHPLQQLRLGSFSKG